MNITDMHLDERYSDPGNGIPQRHTRMGEATGVNDDCIDVTAGFVDAIDDGAFVVGLEVGKCHVEGARLLLRRGDYVREGGGAVDGGFAGTEEVEVGAVDEED